MAGTKMGVVGCGGRMGRMLVAEIAATEGCAVAGGCARPGSAHVNHDIGELAGIGRTGISVGDSAEKLIRDSVVVIDFTAPAATAANVALAARLGKAMVIGTTGLSPEQSDGLHHNSHLYEDKLLRTLRVERLKSPRAHAQQPPSRAHHLLQVPVLERSDAVEQRHVLRTAFHYAEAQGDETIFLVGTVFHHLAVQGGRLQVVKP